MRQYINLVQTLLEGETPSKPLAVIVKGNPKYIRGNKMATRFYDDIKKRLEDKGFRVEFNSGKAYTSPDENAKAWIAHSRGIDRLRFAPDSVQTIALQTKDHDKHFDSNDQRGGDPLHYELSDKDIKAIEALKLD